MNAINNQIVDAVSKLVKILEKVDPKDRKTVIDATLLIITPQVEKYQKPIGTVITPWGFPDRIRDDEYYRLVTGPDTLP
ncbi:MAG: hypothetical protein KBC72_00460 [Acinetobacter sp.]|nr:hypothetical protein [Acinetobacter sp.]